MIGAIQSVDKLFAVLAPLPLADSQDLRYIIDKMLLGIAPVFASLIQEKFLLGMGWLWGAILSTEGKTVLPIVVSRLLVVGGLLLERCNGVIAHVLNPLLQIY